MEPERLGLIVDPLLAWYRQHKRVLPWRGQTDPYRIWVSEIMLQQTRVEAVIPYYERFLRELPDVRALAGCPLSRLNKLWEGLGYYSRVRNMQEAAVQILEKYGGAFPRSRKELLTLKGIGEYTAGAIASIAFQEPVSAVDGNVLRVIARLTGYRQNILDTSAKKEITAWTADIIPRQAPGEFNQAFMDLGAMICVPNAVPLCGSCPLEAWCTARRDELTDSIPLRLSKTRRKTEERTILLIQDGSRTALCRRPEKGLLAGMYEPVNLEGFLEAEQALDWVKDHGLVPLHVEKLPDSKHLFSHLEWRMTGYRIRVSSLESSGNRELLFADSGEVGRTYAIPSAFRAYRGYYIRDEK